MFKRLWHKIVNLFTGDSENKGKIQSSPELLGFYKAWLAWAESESPATLDHRGFLGVGLCGNVTVYAILHDDPELYFKIRNEMQSQFRIAFPHSFVYPFGHTPGYHNPARVKWVRDRIADMKEDANE